MVFKFPHQKSKVFNRQNNAVSIVLLFAFAMLFYSYLLIASRIEYLYMNHNITINTECGIDPKWAIFVTRVAIFDILLTIVIPFVVIVFVNAVLSSQFKFKENPETICVLRKSMQLRRIKIYSKTNRTLFLLSITYIILNMPITFSKLKTFLMSDPIQNDENLDAIGIRNSSSPAENDEFDYLALSATDFNNEIFQRIATNLYYLNFSINFFLYLNGFEFRNMFLDYIKRKKVYVQYLFTLLVAYFGSFQLLSQFFTDGCSNDNEDVR